MTRTPAKISAEGDADIAPHFLEREHGPLLGTPTLWRVLGFTTGDAFRKALQRNTVPVPVFQLPNRRGRFAHTRQVIEWLRQVGRPPVNPDLDRTKEAP